MIRGQRGAQGRGTGSGWLWAIFACAQALAAASAVAQTDYYNLDVRRPLRVEDAYPIERYAIELQLAPLTLSGASNVLFYEPSLELKLGLLPGMELGAGVSAHVTHSSGETSGSVDEIELTTLYNLNTETLGFPAFAIRVTGHVPIEEDVDASAEVKGVITRVLVGAWRAHVNGAWILGDDVDVRWWAGVALDYVLPFRSMLLLAETFYANPDSEDAEGRVRSSAGLRYQLGPRSGFDLGVGRDWSGDPAADWHVTFGLTTALAFRGLMP